MLPFSEIKTALLALTKECQSLWDENKDMQGSFINDLAELQRFQTAIQQLETQQRNGGTVNQSQLDQAKQSMINMQRNASALYQELTGKRVSLVKKLSDGLQQVVVLQNELISKRLFDWKNKQKIAQVGAPFDNKDDLLDEIQAEFEMLADHNWQLRMYASWLLDLLRRGPQLNDNNARTFIDSLAGIVENLTKTLCILVSHSFVVSQQPEPVLKTQHKFGAEVRLLIGDKLGIKQQLDNANVTVKIIAEEEARQLGDGEVQEKDIKTVGGISNDYEKLTLDDKGHMAAKFNNSKLTRIAHRKPPPKGVSVDVKNPTTATDQKYALLFHISPFQLGNLGKFDVWTLSLPLMVTVHGSQDCDAQAAILWQRAFGSVHRSNASSEVMAVSWPQLAEMLKYKFSRFTGALKPLSEADLAYLGEKMLGQLSVGDSKPITFQRFAKQNLNDDVSFSFWEWFFAILQLIKQKLLKFWDEGWLIGFISKNDASDRMTSAARPTFLLRFSDSQTGSVSIGFVCEDEENKTLVPFHLSPFAIKDLDQLSLAQRIASCPQLKEIRYLYPDLDKEEMLRFFDTEERHKSESPTGYIGSEVIMVAKTGGKVPSAGMSNFGDSTPSPSSAHSKLDWSPGDVLVSGVSAMDVSSPEEVGVMFGGGTVDQSSIAFADCESLLGPDFRPELPSQPLELGDLSGFMDSISAFSGHTNSFQLDLGYFNQSGSTSH
uniref:Signal transducer and activator of transcription n=1 Tax=Plectus sambesii TaxID=2011161 RepID=A0A914W282_9BILA